MSPFAEIALVAGRELKRSLRSTKGVLLAALSALGGLGVSVVLTWIDRVVRERAPVGADFASLQEQALAQFYGADTAHLLRSCPYPIWVLFLATQWACPSIVALLTFDAIAAEVGSRTIRFWTVRTRRSSYLLGKALGAWAIVVTVLLGMNVVGWTVTATSGRFGAGEVLEWGLRLFSISIPISAAWCGLATLIGSQFRAPILSLLAIGAAFFALWVLQVSSAVAHWDWPVFLYPNAYGTWLLSPHAADLGRGYAGASVLAFGSLAVASLLFERRDL